MVSIRYTSTLIYCDNKIECPSQFELTLYKDIKFHHNGTFLSIAFN